MKRTILIMSVAFILASCGCDGTKDAGNETEYKSIIENDKFLEKVIYSKVLPSEFDQTINMYLDENGDVQLNGTEKFPAYIDNEMKIECIIPDGHDVMTSEIVASSNSGDELFAFSINEITGIENVEFGTEYCYGGTIFQMDNGNLALFLDYFNYQKLIEINIEAMKVSNVTNFTEITGRTNIYSLKEITDTQTLFYSPENGKIFLYNNITGVQEGSTTTPGYESSQTKPRFTMGEIIKYGDYWYTITESGIYKAKKNTFDWECLIPAEETTCFNHEELVFRDLLIKSEDEIYVIILCDFQELENNYAQETFVEFEIK